MTASRTGKVEAMRVLLARGAKVNAKETWKQQTALMWAAHEGNAEAVKLLLEAGAQVNDRSIFGWTPLLFAARQGQIGSIEALARGRRRHQRDVARRHERARDRGSGAQLRGRGVRSLKHGIDPNASGAGVDGAAPDRLVAPSAARAEQSGPEAAGQRQQPRAREDAGRARRRRQRAADEGADLRHGGAQQPQPLRRDAASSSPPSRWTCR